MSRLRRRGQPPLPREIWQGDKGLGWYSFDHRGVHFVGLVNVSDAKSGSGGGLGQLGTEQLEWLKKDLAGWTMRTDRRLCGSRAALGGVREMGLGKRRSGKRHWSFCVDLVRHGTQRPYPPGNAQVEGKVSFHTACSTAFPQAKPGEGSPGPMRDLPAGKLRGLLGLSTVSYVTGDTSLAVVDSKLE